MAYMTGNDLIAIAQWYPVCRQLREALSYVNTKEIKQILYRPVLYQQGKFEVAIEYREHSQSYWVYIPVKEDDTSERGCLRAVYHNGKWVNSRNLSEEVIDGVWKES